MRGRRLHFGRQRENLKSELATVAFVVIQALNPDARFMPTVMPVLFGITEGDAQIAQSSFIQAFLYP
jgi:hypothetical protein